MSTALEQLNSRILKCRACPRLVECRETVAVVKRRAFQHDDYWGRPVPGLGSRSARVLIVGLAPGAHGANRTGRVFTGDSSGDFLFPALHRAGLANQPTADTREDGLRLIDCYITLAVRCVPPGNRPDGAEQRECNAFLQEELKLLRKARVYLCLGRIAFEAFERAAGERFGPFGHGVAHNWKRRQVVCSYHVSRQNTQTGRLTKRMFDTILKRVNRLAGRLPPS